MSEQINVNEAFDPNLRQAQQDFDAYIGSRPFREDAKGNIHDMQNGQYVKEEAAHAHYDQQREDHYEAAGEETDQDYEDMGVMTLAEKLAEAYHNADGTAGVDEDDARRKEDNYKKEQARANYVHEVLDRKIEDLQQKSLSDRDVEHNADRAAAIRDRVMGRAEKHLAELEGKTTEPTDPEPTPRSEPDPTTEPEPTDGGSGDDEKPAPGEAGEPLGPELRDDQQKIREDIEGALKSALAPNVPTVEQLDKVVRLAGRVSKSDNGSYFGPRETPLSHAVAESLKQSADEDTWILQPQRKELYVNVHEETADQAGLTDEQLKLFKQFKEELAKHAPDVAQKYDTDEKVFDAFKVYAGRRIELSDALVKRREEAKAGKKSAAHASVKPDWNGTRAQREAAYEQRKREPAPLQPTRSEQLRRGISRFIGAVSLSRVRRTTEDIEEETVAYNPSRSAKDAFFAKRETWNHGAIDEARSREIGKSQRSSDRWQALRKRYENGSRKVSDATVSALDQLRLRSGTMPEMEVAFRATRRGIQQGTRRRNR